VVSSDVSANTWSYDPGYLPGDLRYGLSPKELAAFYQSRQPQWLIRSTYGPDALAKREGAMQAHISYLSARKDQIRFVGPFLADDGVTPTGNWLMIDVPDRASAAAFIAGEGFNRAGMFKSIEIKRFAETSVVEPRQLEMTPDPKMQLYVCELIDGPRAAEIRKTTGPAHHKYQEGLMGRFLAHGPIRTDDGRGIIGTLYLIAAENRAAAERLVADEPMTKAGVFSEIRIDRWRFGKSIL
jgi:uncharacterized protein